MKGYAKVYWMEGDKEPSLDFRVTKEKFPPFGKGSVVPATVILGTLDEVDFS